MRSGSEAGVAAWGCPVSQRSANCSTACGSTGAGPVVASAGAGGRPRTGMLDAGDEPRHVGRERAVPKRQRLPVDQRLDRLRQLGRGGHQRVLDQDRNDPDAALQGDADLLDHPVGRVVDAPPSLVVGEADPAIPDEGQQHVTAADGPAYVVGEVHPGRDGVDVHEELELLAQPISDAARDVLGVGTPIAQEDFDPVGHQSSSLRPRAAPDLSSVWQRRSTRGTKAPEMPAGGGLPGPRPARLRTRSGVRFWT